MSAIHLHSRLRAIHSHYLLVLQRPLVQEPHLSLRICGAKVAYAQAAARRQRQPHMRVRLRAIAPHVRANAGGARVCGRGKFAPSTIRSKFAPFIWRGIDAPGAHIRRGNSHIRNAKSHVRYPVRIDGAKTPDIRLKPQSSLSANVR